MDICIPERLLRTFIGVVTVVLNVIVFIWTDPILTLLQIPEDVYPLMYDYIRVIFAGIIFIYLYKRRNLNVSILGGCK